MPLHKSPIVDGQSSIVNKNGFTLIEIIVVIAIIGILAGIALVSYTNAQVKSLDKQRKSEVTSIKQALVAAKIDDGFYKSNLTDGTLIPKYIDKIPKDPKTDSDYTYKPLNSSNSSCDNSANNKCTSFTIIACLDNENDTQKDDTTNATCTTPSSYTITSPQ